MASEKKMRKFLNKKIVQLNDVIADIDSMLTEMETEFFRVSIFGSARLKPESPLFQEVYDLAFEVSKLGVDIVTGGGPGLMQAANKGAKDGGASSKSIGLHIELPFEVDPNNHLDIKRHHRRFSSRLDEFMRISHAVIITPGGIGTILELFYTWQLIQVKHISPKPIIFLGGEQMWPELIQWLQKWPVALELMYEADMRHIEFCETVDDVVKIIQPVRDAFYNKGKP